MRHVSAVLCGLFLLFCAGAASADIVTYSPLQCGEDKREDAGGTCLQETSFYAGAISAAMHLKVGGDTAGCNSEWATSLEFDLGAGPPLGAIMSATLIVRKTGYSDDSQGFAYIGAFAYQATGFVVTVERADLTPETALSIVYPTAANTDLSFDVTPAIQALVSGGKPCAGLLLAGVYSEVGYEDWISVGGANYSTPPRLVVAYARPIAIRGVTWSVLRSLYR